MFTETLPSNALAIHVTYDYTRIFLIAAGVTGLAVQVTRFGLFPSCLLRVLYLAFGLLCKHVNKCTIRLINIIIQSYIYI
jgi:hypothetical protein